MAYWSALRTKGVRAHNRYTTVTGLSKGYANAGNSQIYGVLIRGSDAKGIRASAMHHARGMRIRENSHTEK